MGTGAERVAVVTDVMSPYRFPVFRELGRSLGDHFRVFFMGVGQKSRQWERPTTGLGFGYEVVGGFRILDRSSHGYSYFVNPLIDFRLAAFAPTMIILGGYHHPTSFLVKGFAKREGIKLVMWSESTPVDERSALPFVDGVKRRFLAECDAYLVPGARSRDYLVSMGADVRGIHVAPNAADVETILRGVGGEEGAPEANDPLRSASTLLFVGRLAREKNVPLAIGVTARLAGRGLDVQLLIVGDGPERAALESEAVRVAPDRVRFAGYKRPEELGRYYANALALILPSTSEPWGLVVNEAMACGLPVICSKFVGAASDMVEEGETGFQCAGVDDYLKAACLLLANPAERRRMGHACVRRGREFSPAAAARGFLNLVEAVGR